LRIVDDAHRVPTEAIDIQAPSSHAPSIFEPPSVSDAAIEVAETALGGVMFLINAFTALGLFELLYEQPDLGAMVGSWAWLEHIARALIGRDHPEFDGDSIWRVLATLDGRAPDDRLSANSVEQLRALTATTLETLRARLLAVMTLPSDAAEQLVPALLACPALIASGPTHVDVRMALSDARGAVRLAGLDATPGWVAPLGRVITFYFA
jgi:hypothetical protein